MISCCNNENCKDTAGKLIIIGGGSAAFAAATRAVELGAEKVTIINSHLPTGGTCVNVGCVPSKTLLRAAESLHRARSNPFAGIQTGGSLADFSAVIQEKRQLVAALREAKYVDVIRNLPQVELIHGHAKLLDANSVQVVDRRLSAEHLIIATGAAPTIPPIPGLADAGYLTNESAFELEALPESLIVLGGRYIALECAQMFARFGSRVTVLQRSDHIVPTEADDITDALAGYLEAEGLEIHTGAKIERVDRSDAGVTVKAMIQGERRSITAAQILVATGRRPNTGNLGLETADVELDEHGFIKVGPTLETSHPGIWAAGDVIGGNMFVYTAAYEGALAAENAISGAGRKSDYTALPWVVFTDPQLAGVGMDERQAATAGYDAEAASLPLHHVPRAIAARDTRGVIKLIRDRKTDLLLGARILAPEGAELLMEAALAIKFGITVRQIRDSFHPYLTLGEGIKLAAITFGKDVAQLSCCAT
ncbi:MAG: mercury(II) reductase [Phycisphaerae bacterium]